MNLKTSFTYQLYPRDGAESTTGYYICIYRNLDTGKKVTVKGNDLPRKKQINYEMQVKEVIDKKHGLQYEMISYKDYVEACENAIITYLSSGIIKGIGNKTAQKIYNKFGNKTMDIFEHEIERLTEVSGITKKKMETIKESYLEKSKYQEASTFLLKYDFSLHQIKQVINLFRENTLDEIKDNPYFLMQINGIDFEKVEPIARDLGIPKEDYRRVKGAAMQILRNNMNAGNSCMELYSFCNLLAALLKSEHITKQNVHISVLRLIKDHFIFYRKKETDNKIEEYVFHASAVQAEHDIAKLSLAMVDAEKRAYTNIEKDIQDFSKDFTLDISQKNAIKMALTEPISIITGGPGTGKSTIVKMICDIYEKYNDKALLLASPTGRAARRMTECTNREASTIHHMLGLGFDKNPNMQQEDVVIEDCMVIIDEFSMVDMFIAQKLLKSLVNCQLVIVGDSNQLESVGPGCVLADLLKSECIPAITLNCTYRQEEGSLIIKNTENMKKGIPFLEQGEDFRFIEEADMEKVEQYMVEDYVQEVQKNGLEKVLCICPFHDYHAGTIRMNKILQERLNPSGERWSATERDYRIGDPVMQLRNMDEISNGDIGYITAFYKKEDESVMEVTYFNSYKKLYKVEDLQDITLAYATTVHKSQGSEADTVIMCLTNFHASVLRTSLKRNLPYTGATRGKKKERIYGNMEALKKAIANTTPRTTLLWYEIKKQRKKNKKEEKTEIYTQLKLAL